MTKSMIQDYVLSVAVSHDGQWVVSGSKDRGVQFWDSRSAIVQFMLQGHKNSGIRFLGCLLLDWLTDLAEISYLYRPEPFCESACYWKWRLGCPNMCVPH
jgi:WD40 repeat protein